LEEFLIDFIETKRKVNPNRISISKLEENVTRVKPDVNHHVYMNLFDEDKDWHLNELN
jgi:hypothetical protein